MIPKIFFQCDFIIVILEIKRWENGFFVGIATFSGVEPAPVCYCFMKQNLQQLFLQAGLPFKIGRSMLLTFIILFVICDHHPLLRLLITASHLQWPPTRYCQLFSNSTRSLLPVICNHHPLHRPLITASHLKWPPTRYSNLFANTIITCLLFACRLHCNLGHLHVNP